MTTERKELPPGVKFEDLTLYPFPFIKDGETFAGYTTPDRRLIVLSSEQVKAVRR